MIVNSTSVTSLVGDEMVMRLIKEDINGEVLFGVDMVALKELCIMVANC